MNIGTKIKELRNHNKKTQEDLAKTLCISTQAVSKWENGGSPDLELIPAIAKYFKVSTDYLFDIEDYELTNIENKLFKYITSFNLNERIQQVYRLGFIMSIATRGEEIIDLDKFKEEITNDDLFSVVVSEDGIIITSLAQNNKVFTVIPKDNKSNYLKMLESKEKQMLFCKYLSDNIFYDSLVFLYSRSRTSGSFTEKLLCDNLNVTLEEAKDILEKMKEFKIVSCTMTPIDDTEVKLYSVLQNPHIVSLIQLLDMVSNRPNNYCHYYGGPTNYFEKK